MYEGGEIMATARTRANRRYNEKNYDKIQIQAHKGTRAQWKQEADARGLSLAALIVTAVTEYLTQHPPEPGAHQLRCDSSGADSDNY